MPATSVPAPFHPRRGDRRRDRRRALLVALSGRGRRHALRRAEDRRHGAHYLDRYRPADGLVLLLAVVLCVLDAAFTLTLLAHGGEELNPLMAFALGQGVTEFFWIKFLLTSGALLVALLHRDFVAFGRLRGVHILYGAAVGYTVLVGYELVLLGALVSG